MLITKIGEFGLIKRFRKLIKTDSSVIKGSGDDCAVLALNKSGYQLFTCDMIVEGVDFTAKDDPYFIGRKALAIQISDIAACAGIPHHCLISLAMPRNTSVEFVDRLFKGMNHMAKKYNINIVGGDISRAKQLTIDVSMLGIVEKKNLVLRDGARIGDIIFVSGPLGGSIFGKHLKFIPRLEEARFLVKNFKVNAMIDISDGLIQDLGHILKQSKAGAIVYEKLIPLSKQARNLSDALYMGEDFELLFSVSHNEARRILKRNIKNFYPIGEIVTRKFGLKLIDKKSREKIISPFLNRSRKGYPCGISPKGFQHF